MNIIDLSLTMRTGMRGIAWDTHTTLAEEGWKRIRSIRGLMVSLVCLVQAIFPCHDCILSMPGRFQLGRCVSDGARVLWRCAGGTPMSSGAGIRAAQAASSNSSWRSRWGGAMGGALAGRPTAVRKA